MRASKRGTVSGAVRSGQVNAVLSRCRSTGTQLIRFLYCGNDGVIRGKACHAEFLPSYLRSGIGMTVAMQSFTMLDQLAPEGSFGPTGEFRLIPDLDTFTMLPYAPKTARLLCDMQTPEGVPWDACPRRFLRRMIERAARRGFGLKAAFENEFTLARRDGERYVPLDRSPYGSTTGMDSAAPVIMDIIEALRAQGVHPEQYYPELGPGQQELPVRFADGLRAADNQLTVRETVRGIALTHGLVASFAPKPYPEEAGNGSHIHWSLWGLKDRANLFHDPKGRHGLSEAGYAFIGGVLAHLPALVALTAPSVNSYRRLLPRLWCGAYAAWGPDNREAAVRIPRNAARWRWNRPTSSSNPAIPRTTPIWPWVGCWRPAWTDWRARSTRASPPW